MILDDFQTLMMKKKRLYVLLASLAVFYFLRFSYNTGSMPNIFGICDPSINQYVSLSGDNPSDPLAATFSSSLTNLYWMKEMEDKYSKINIRIRKVCKELRSYNPSDFENRNPESLSTDLYKNMVLDMNHGLSYCRHGKVITELLLITFIIIYMLIY